jgi:hypothetical protein
MPGGDHGIAELVDPAAVARWRKVVANTGLDPVGLDDEHGVVLRRLGDQVDVVVDEEQMFLLPFSTQQRASLAEMTRLSAGGCS